LEVAEAHPMLEKPYMTLYPIKEDVKKKRFSPPLCEMRVW
jgi:hypothetical protein